MSFEVTSSSMRIAYFTSMNFVIGKIHSGITITSDTLDLDTLPGLDDQFDALALMEAFSSRERRVNGASEHFVKACRQAEKLHSRLRSADQLDAAMSVRGLKNYFGRLRYGRELLSSEFRD